MDSNVTINWYNGFSKIYDLMSDYPYQKVRETAIQTLNLDVGDVVIDLFCGTGVNFKSLAEELGNTGRIIAIDGSPGMLSKAQDRIRRLNLKQEQFALHEQDLLAIEANFLEGLIPQGIVPKVLMTLGVAGHPDWNPFWDHLFEALPVGTPITTMDVCCREGSLSARVISLIGSGKFNADIASFQAWERLKARCRDYEEKTYHPFNILRCSVIVATGRKPS